MRQEQFEEALDLFDAFARGLHHAGGAHALRVGRAEREHLIEQFLTQREFDAFGGLATETCGGANGDESHDRGNKNNGDAGRGGGRYGREQRLQHTHHSHDEGDVGHEAQPLAGDFRRDQSTDAVSQGKQPLVEHHAPFPIVCNTAIRSKRIGHTDERQ